MPTFPPAFRCEFGAPELKCKYVCTFCKNKHNMDMNMDMDIGMDVTESPAVDTLAPKVCTVFGIHHGFVMQMAQYVETTGMGAKRCMFSAMRRQPEASADTFLPRYGLTVGEFASLLVMTVL